MKQYRIPLILSVALHVAIAGLLLANISFAEKEVKPKPVPEVVKATVIDESKILAELEKIKQAENAKSRAEKDRQKKLKQEQEHEQKRLADLKKKRQLEEQRAKEEAARNKKREKAEKERLAKLKKEKETEKKRLEKLKKEKELAEKKRREEAARKKKLAEEKKARELAEKKRKERLAKEKAEKERKAREEALKKQLAEEKRAREAVASFRDVIRQKIERNWLKPATSGAGLSCKIRVKLIPGGGVMAATVIKSSGDPLFDRSVEVAVLKASPLPVPDDSTLFNYFRTLELNFNPKE